MKYRIVAIVVDPLQAPRAGDKFFVEDYDEDLEVITVEKETDPRQPRTVNR